MQELIFYTGSNKEAHQAFSEIFKDVPTVNIISGNITNGTGDCVITAGNALGYMDGGIDGHIKNWLSYAKEEYIDIPVRNKIKQLYNGILPIGTSIMVPTNNPYISIKWLVYSPTMFIPDNVNNTLNAFFAFKGALREIILYNQINKDNPIKRVLCCCFCTGAGEMNVYKSAKQMKFAYESFFNSNEYNWKSAREIYDYLLK